MNPGWDIPLLSATQRPLCTTAGAKPPHHGTAPRGTFEQKPTGLEWLELSAANMTSKAQVAEQASAKGKHQSNSDSDISTAFFGGFTTLFSFGWPRSSWALFVFTSRPCWLRSPWALFSTMVWPLLWPRSPWALISTFFWPHPFVTSFLSFFFVHFFDVSLFLFFHMQQCHPRQIKRRLAPRSAHAAPLGPPPPSPAGGSSVEAYSGINHLSTGAGFLPSRVFNAKSFPNM